MTPAIISASTFSLPGQFWYNSTKGNHFQPDYDVWQKTKQYEQKIKQLKNTVNTKNNNNNKNLESRDTEGKANVQGPSARPAVVTTPTLSLNQAFGNAPIAHRVEPF